MKTKARHPAVLGTTEKIHEKKTEQSVFGLGLKPATARSGSANRYTAIFVRKHYCEMNQNAIYR
jgi:hypothetical protein